MNGLTLPQSIYRELVDQAATAAPIESCGILAGREGRVETFVPMTNTDASTDHFMMDPREQFRVVKALRIASQRMLAIHHSHPASPARPSEEDIRLANTPGVIYTILSLAEPGTPRLKGFVIDEGVVSEIPVTISPDEPI